MGNDNPPTNLSEKRMKKIRMLLLFWALCISTILMVPDQTLAYTYKGRTATVVSGDIPLKVRKGPSTSYEVKTTLKSGSKVTIIKKVGDWYKVTCKKNTKGYCYGAYLKLDKKKSSDNSSKKASSSGVYGKVSKGEIPLKLRKSPTTKSKILARIPRGKKIKIIGYYNKSWYKAKWNGKTGYVSADYIILPKGTKLGEDIPKVSGSKKSGNKSEKDSTEETKKDSSNTSKKKKSSKGVYCRVTNGKVPLKLRKSPTTNSKILAEIPRGTKIKIIGYYNKSWYKAKWNGKTGYVSSDYIILPDGIKLGKDIPKVSASNKSSKGNTTISGNIKKKLIGTSGEGRKIYAYQVGTGKNHIVITAAVHGWEDSWARDSALLTATAKKLLNTASKNISQLNKYNYSIYVIPRMNPDGYYSGYTHNGPGRCTTRRYNNSGTLVKGGVDLNRCFPAGFNSFTNARNYTGQKPLAAKEAKLLKKYLDQHLGSGTNIYIDMHGWYDQTITYRSGSGALYKCFKSYFSGTRASSFAGSKGYIARYAQSAGYQAVLFEFPYVKGSNYFYNKNMDQKFIRSVMKMVRTIS